MDLETREYTYTASFSDFNDRKAFVRCEAQLFTTEIKVYAKCLEEAQLRADAIAELMMIRSDYSWYSTTFKYSILSPYKVDHDY